MNPRMTARLGAMTTGLSLTPDQVSQVTEIFTNWQQQRRQLKQQNVPQEQLHEARKAMKQSVENLLTPAQKETYAANMQKYWQAGAEEDDDNG